MHQAPSTLAAQVAALPDLPMNELWPLWDRFFKRRPDNPNRAYLESRLAYKLQEAALGGLAPQTQRRLANIGQQYSKINARRSTRTVELAPGTQLIRQWGAREHQVTVNADGRFDYEGHSFKSLSAVARHISGTRWSGPLFFGLNQDQGEAT